jgi:hypothetical protein
VACEALEGFEDNLKQLEHGLVRCQYLCKQAHASMETLQQSRSSAIENLSTFGDRMRTAVERVIVQCETEVNAAFEKKRKAVAACLTTYETSMAELRTMQAIVMAAKDKEACAVLRLNVKESVNTTLDLARELEGVQALHPKVEATWQAQFSHVLKRFHSLLELEHPDAVGGGAAGGGGGAAGGGGGGRAAGGGGGAAAGGGGGAGGDGAAAGYVFAARRGLACVSGFGVDIMCVCACFFFHSIANQLDDFRVFLHRRQVSTSTKKLINCLLDSWWLEVGVVEDEDHCDCAFCTRFDDGSSSSSDSSSSDGGNSSDEDEFEDEEDQDEVDQDEVDSDDSSDDDSE